MSYTLVITEKPSAARKIARALAAGAVKQKTVNKASWLELERNRESIIVVPAVGHLFTVAQKSKTWTYPVFDVKWVPTYTQKGSSYARRYYSNIKRLAKKASSFVVATDLDVEGETIAFNILRHICGVDDAARMEFSTLTAGELVRSYEKRKEHINKGLADAGIARHVLDFYFGINVSRALTLSMKSVGKYKVLSSGRVQGPALAFLVKREKEIRAFKSRKFWQVELATPDFKALYEKKQVWEKEEAYAVKNDCDGKDAAVNSVEMKRYKKNAPHPFNLTDLQVEAYKLFGISPRETQAIAQKLYEAALISYPRTSSQQLPERLGLKQIVNKLAKNKAYKNLTRIVLKTALRPNNGKKKDEAHPAIHPTGELAKGLEGRDRKVYDLIVKRFFATFGRPAEREMMDARLDCASHIFVASGKRTVEEGWLSLYHPYTRLDDRALPELEKGQGIAVTSVDVLGKETQPPARYNQASIIRELEKRNLGTKATRAEIVSNLYKRGYLDQKRIEVSDLGMKVVETLEKYCPEILSEELTRRFEAEMREIEKRKRRPEEVTREAEDELTKILKRFKEHEKNIGRELAGSAREAERKASELGPCPECGGTLVMMRSRNGGRFVGCSSYPKCGNMYPLPRMGMIKKTSRICRSCRTPFVSVIRKGRKPWRLCLDPKCETKKGWNKK